MTHRSANGVAHNVPRSARRLNGRASTCAMESCYGQTRTVAHPLLRLRRLLSAHSPRGETLMQRSLPLDSVNNDAETLTAISESDPSLSEHGVVRRPVRAAAVAVGSVATLAVTALIAVLVAIDGVARPLLAIAAWGVVLMLAFLGWGSVLRRVLAPRRAADIGLRLGWGMGVVAAFGGFLLAMRIVSRVTTFALVALGLAALCTEVFFVAKGAKLDRAALGRWKDAHPWFWLLTALLAAMGAVLYCGSILDSSRWYVWDDAPAYFVFPKEMLERGASIQPFSVRRLQSWGGQSFFQALFVARVPEGLLRPHIFDRGLCSLVLAALLLGGRLSRRGELGRLLAILALGALFTLPNNRENSTSELSGAVFFLALYRTVQWANAVRPRWQHGVLLGVLVAGACALRQNYCVVAVGTVAASYAFAFWTARSHPQVTRRISEECLAAAGTTAVLLLPWSLQAYQTFRAWMFPLTRGNFRVALSGMSVFPSPVARIQSYWDNAMFAFPITAGPILVLAAMLVREENSRRPFAALLFASAIGFVAEIWFLPLITPNGHGRYYFASEVALVLALALAASRGQGGHGRLTERALPGLVAAVGLILQMYTAREEITKGYTGLIQAMGKVMTQSIEPAKMRSQPYDEAQAAVPAGAPMLVMVEEPFRFDFARNPVHIVDFPGGVSPRPGMPTNGNEQELIAYLERRAIRYLVFVNFSASTGLYKRKDWEEHAAANVLTEHKLLGPAFVGMMNAIDRLRTTRRVLYHGGDMFVVDLQAPAAD